MWVGLNNNTWNQVYGLSVVDQPATKISYQRHPSNLFERITFTYEESAEFTEIHAFKLISVLISLGRKKNNCSSQKLYQTRRVSDGYRSVQARALCLRETLTLVWPGSASYRFFLQLPMRKSLELYYHHKMCPLSSWQNIYHPDLRVQ